MFFESFKITGSGVLQVLLLGSVGYFLFRKDFLGPVCLTTLSRLVIEVTLPLMIFSQLVGSFSFRQFPDWWIYPLLSLAITLIGLAVGVLLSCFIDGNEARHQLISLVAFQNSGYLPLALVAAFLPAEQAQTVFIYIFLFLLGFNLAMFSLGVFILNFSHQPKFELRMFFNPPVVAMAITMLLVATGLSRFIPAFFLKPVRMVGDCTLPLAMLVTGAGLAQIRLEHVNKKAMALLNLGKLIILPSLGIVFLKVFNVPELIGLLIVLQLAVPSANTLSVIIAHQKRDDVLISQGIFWSHILSMVTIPVFLSLYFSLGVVK